MCGISGLVLRASASPEESLIERMTSTSFRRGPDAQGIARLGKTLLGHRRLKIIDLSDEANQPMFSPDRKCALVFNGEIYNFRELRAELETHGRTFKTSSDTEVILHAYQVWGEAAFRRLNGMFAFALWDGQNGEESSKLYLVRDRFGIKPVFYSESDGKLAFASELKPLLEVPWVRKEVDPAVVFQFIKFSHVPTPLSILKSVRQLEPGVFLRFEGGSSKITCYWSAKELTPEIGVQASHGHKQVERWLNELDSVLSRCVQRQLVSDVPVGCFLSGGIDSSLIALAYGEGRSQAGTSGPLNTFSVGYEEGEFDETPFAREIARIIGSSHHEMIFRPRDFFDLIPDVPTYFDQPFADPTLLPSLLLSKFAREKVTVALSGDGGDELFFGYPHQRAMVLAARFQWVPLQLRKSVLSSAHDALKIMSRGPMRRIGHAGQKLAEILQFRSEAELFQYFVGTLGPIGVDRLSALLIDSPDTKIPFFSDLADEIKELPLADRVQQVFLRTFLVDTVLAKTDRAGMAYGLEARVPLLDNEMAEFASRVPFDLKFRNGTSKWLLRKLLKRKLDALGLSSELPHRKKQGFSIPIREWLRGDLKYLLDEYLRPARLRREGIFDSASVSILVKEHLGGHSNHSHLLWSLICFEMWRERYL